MPLTAADISVYPAANKPEDDVSTSGGGIGGSPITGGSAGEIFPFLAAPPAGGTLDDDATFQVQKLFFKNSSSTNDLLSAKAYLANGLIRPPSGTGRAFIVIRNASDASKIVRVWHNIGGVIVPESITCPTSIGTGAATQGALATSLWVERAQLLSGSSPYGQTYAAGAIEIWWGNTIGTAIKLGCIPAPEPSPGPSWGWATAEVQMLGAGSLNDTATVSNRLTLPSGTFARANSYAAGLDVTNTPAADLTQGDAWGVWAMQKLQPGMPVATVQYCWAIAGDTSA